MSTAVRVTLKRLFLFLLLVSTIDGLAPNFDTFCQNAVGRWASAGSSSSSATVSEVMRSCGGAVQGVRETGVGAGVYLNRADDNFAYFGTLIVHRPPLAAACRCSLTCSPRRPQSIACSPPPTVCSSPSLQFNMQTMPSTVHRRQLTAHRLQQLVVAVWDAAHAVLRPPPTTHRLLPLLSTQPMSSTIHRPLHAAQAVAAA